MHNLYEEIECGSKDNACFPLALSNATGTDPEFYSRALQRHQGSMVDMGELVASGDGILGEEARDSRLEVFRVLLEEEGTRLKIYTLGQDAQGQDHHRCPRRIQPGKPTILIPFDDPQVDINPQGSHVVRLLFNNSHYTRLVKIDRSIDLGRSGDRSFKVSTQDIPVISSTTSPRVDSDDEDAEITTILRNPISSQVVPSANTGNEASFTSDEWTEVLNYASRTFQKMRLTSKES